jgi:hypothetical protein
VEAELAEVKAQLKKGLSEKEKDHLWKETERLGKKEEQLRAEKLILLQQQQAATPAGARALCVCPRVFGFVCYGVVALVLGLVWGLLLFGVVWFWLLLVFWGWVCFV